MTSPTPLLDTITCPEDVRKLSRAKLPQLVEELRHELIRTVSQVGGHFASSLGVAELTVALHAFYNTPLDRLVWDVGHQAYIHKILTGRRKELPSVRQFGGISGFPRRCESPYDTFGVAHAGTSISAASGMIEASTLSNAEADKRRVVAVIGDGAMTAGMAFEAFNHSGQLHRNLVVILNDNEMSIAPNVGAISWAFSKAVTGKFSTCARKHFKSLVERRLIPKSFYRVADRAEEAAQGFFSAPAMLFTSFGYRYIGPIDGHNLDQIFEALEHAEKQDGPVLIHALTVKGKGYEPAEADPVTYHGVGPFAVEDGSFKKSNSGSPSAPSYTEVFGRTMVELCENDSRVVGITAAMPDGTGLTLLAQEKPEKFYDVGIAEQHAVTFAAGLACEGVRPVCAIYSTFLQRAYDQIIHDVCIQSLPVIFALDRGGLVGADGPTHHGVFDFAYLRGLPNMTVMAPKDESELRDMMYTAVQHTDGPIAYRYPRGNGIGADIKRPPQVLPIGKGEVILEAPRGKKHVALVGIGITVDFCRDAAALLEKDGVCCSVVNARFVKPLDEELLHQVIREHDLVITVEDHALVGGFGSAVLEFMSESGLTAETPLLRLGIEDTFIEHGTQKQLYRLCGFDPESIRAHVLQNLAKRHPTTRAANA